MGKSKSGGTRSYLRGKVGADVYSIGKDGKGKKQQVVRSLAETVANPQTESQMRGRMIMSTVMQAQSGLAQLVNHSFDSVPAGQPSLSEFIRQNYKLVKDDVAAHPSASNVFGLVKYKERGAKGGAYVIASGSAVMPASVSNITSGSAAGIRFAQGSTATTAGAIREALGVAVGDYLTLCWIDSKGNVDFFRVFITDTLADATTVTSENVAQLFSIEGTVNPTVELDTSNGRINITWTLTDSATVQSHGIIVSNKDNAGWIHNNCKMTVIGNPAFTAAVALPTYPTGEERFLNGGEL